MDPNEIYALEKSMWESAKNRDPAAFLYLVSKDAVMVCGGYRCSGSEYAEIIAMFDCKSYSIEHFEIVDKDASSIQVHYVIHLEVNNDENKDLAGTFHITTTWHNIEGTWKVVFNMDQRVFD